MIIDGSTISLSEGNKGKIIPKPDMEKEFPDYKYFAPIPYQDLNLNDNLEQNEGW